MVHKDILDMFCQIFHHITGVTIASSGTNAELAVSSVIGSMLATSSWDLKCREAMESILPGETLYNSRTFRGWRITNSKKLLFSLELATLLWPSRQRLRLLESA